MDRDARWSHKQFLAVLDGSLRPQLLADRELDAENGRGMSLVTAMSTDWGVAATPMDGKSTWAAFDTQSATPPSEGMGGSAGWDLPGRS